MNRASSRVPHSLARSGRCSARGTTSVDGVVAQPRTQPVDERHRHRRLVAGQETEVAAGERRRESARERHCFHHGRQLDARKPLAQHGDQVRGLARRRGERDADSRCGNAGLHADIALVRERKRELEDAQTASGEPARELVDEAVRRERECLDVGDGRRQFEPALVARRRHERQARIGNEPARAIERGDEIGAHAPRQRIARERARLPERRHAGGGERRDGLRREIEMGERQRCERCEQRARAAVAVAE